MEDWEVKHFATELARNNWRVVDIRHKLNKIPIEPFTMEELAILREYMKDETSLVSLFQRQSELPPEKKRWFRR